MEDTLKSQEETNDPDSFIEQYIRYIDTHLHNLFPKTKPKRISR